GKRETHAAQNSKPAKKPATPRGEMTSKSTNQKTIGINKHGTLLSSQTTEAIHILCKVFIYISVLLCS
ncbi:hypothetical protein, partial [Arthrobacter tumbae]